jgi:hypothetical protein
MLELCVSAALVVCSAFALAVAHLAERSRSVEFYFYERRPLTHVLYKVCKFVAVVSLACNARFILRTTVSRLG